MPQFVIVDTPDSGQTRATFTSAEVGNGSPNDSGTLANQDGGLAVRLQAEGPGDTLIGRLRFFLLPEGRLPGRFGRCPPVPAGRAPGDGRAAGFGVAA